MQTVQETLGLRFGRMGRWVLTRLPIENHCDMYGGDHEVTHTLKRDWSTTSREGMALEARERIIGLVAEEIDPHKVRTIIASNDGFSKRDFYVPEGDESEFDDDDSFGDFNWSVTTQLLETNRLRALTFDYEIPRDNDELGFLGHDLLCLLRKAHWNVLFAETVCSIGHIESPITIVYGSIRFSILDGPDPYVENIEYVWDYGHQCV